MDVKPPSAEPRPSPPGVLTESGEGWGLAICCLAASTVLALTLQLTNGSFRLDAIRGLTWAIALGALGVFLPRFTRSWRWGEPALALGLGVALLLQVRLLFLEHPTVFLRLVNPWPYAEFYAHLAVAVLVAGTLLAGPEPLRRVGVPVLLVVYLLLGVWILQRSTEPFIDVFVFQTQGPDRLLHGGNPYAMTFPNIYGHSLWYGEGLVKDGRLQFGFPYPPLSLWLSTLARVVAGDPRYAQLLATVLSAGFMAGSRGGRIGAGIAALYLLAPRGFFVLDQSWTEPFLVLFLSASVFCACRFPRALPYVFGLLLAIKQYTVFLVPLAWLLLPEPRRQAWDFAWRAAAVGLAVSLPLVLIDVGAFLRSVVTLQLYQPFRTDALSYLAWWVHQGHPQPPLWVPFAAVAVVLALCLWRAPRTPAGFAAATALTYVVFFALNKQAFCNYYSFVVGAWCVAVAAARLPPAHSSTTAPAPGLA
jgi:hypothetical protein